jgi:hypothetical protein
VWFIGYTSRLSLALRTLAQSSSIWNDLHLPTSLTSDQGLVVKIDSHCT